MGKAIVIFDFDGTIADSFEFVSSFLVRESGHGVWSLTERRRQFAGLSMRHIADKLGISPWRSLWMYFYGRRAMTKQLARIKAFDGVVEAVLLLHGYGHELFLLSSNRHKNMQIFLQQHGIAGCFSAIQGSASLVGKTLVLKNLLWRYELDRANCVYVGDEADDLKAARRLGIRAVAVTWGYNNAKTLAAEEPYAIAKTPKELTNILTGLAP